MAVPGVRLPRPSGGRPKDAAQTGWSHVLPDIDMRAANSPDRTPAAPPSVPEQKAAGGGGPGDQARSLFAALDLLLESITGPALLLSCSGAILKMNSSARGLRPAELAVTSGGGGKGFDRWPSSPAVAGRLAGWHLTAVHAGDEAIGYLATPKAPAPVESPLHDELEAASARWRLTKRQASVLELVARGYPNDIIAESLGIATGTVEHHVTRVLDKAGAFSRASLILRMLEVGRRPGR